MEAKFDKVVTILDEHGRQQHKLIPILQDIQRAYKYLPKEVLLLVSTALGISPAKVYGVATFYHHFALEPKGKYVIRVCDGTACHVKGSNPLIEVLQRAIGLEPEQKTSSDQLFTLETVSCLGACGLAPVVLVNDTVHGQVTTEKASEIIRELRIVEGRSE
jgi:NADH-quinone oxidoreductase subunit E